MYSRNADGGGTDSTFGVSGKLWNGVLVMYDRTTKSLWTQIDGRAIEGERAGEHLEHVPSLYTTWSAWLAAHPDTLVLEKPEDVRQFDHSRYDDYLADPDELFMPELAQGLGGVRPKDVVFGVRVEGHQAAVTEELLVAQTVVNGVAGDIPVAWIRRTATGAVLAVDRRHEGRVLVLSSTGNKQGWVRDTLSGTTLSPQTLRRLRVDRAFWYAWKRSHPASTILAR